ncbi:RNA polymerase sigma factor [Aminipila butyrica]|uniref:RNA polymerase sigma factor n=1 Tax=Aminipila butyrica TaxID=433296 RepID=A0A858BT69_9FIRM|nr:RNA polymerase sigma factor [Aminipila butyrica]QIB68552.1 RNA polymerase sigma factor [Aminipila butyrica]
MNDEQCLIRRIQKKGDRKAADCLVRLYYEEIFRFIRKQTFDEEIALDLTQSSFISMLRTIAHYDPKKAGFRTWLYKIATNKTVDYFRSHAGQLIKVLPLDEVEPTVATDFTKQIEDAEFARKVEDFIARFPGDTQRIFRLHIFGGYTFMEIAEGLGIPEGTAKTTYYRLIHILRKEFSDYDE